MALCTVYRSDRKTETYLYLAQGRTFEDLPQQLREAFGEPAFVMRLELDADRRLARVDARRVLQHLEADGFYLQLPPEIPVEEEITRRFSRGP
jgi:uncharacterized protein YcgL (UPF0745 family)